MTGRATSFVTFDERDQLCEIETMLGHPVPLAEGSSRLNDRPPLRTSERSRGDRQQWGVQARTKAGIS